MLNYFQQRAMFITFGVGALTYPRPSPYSKLLGDENCCTVPNIVEGAP